MALVTPALDALADAAMTEATNRGTRRALDFVEDQGRRVRARLTSLFRTPTKRIQAKMPSMRYRKRGYSRRGRRRGLARFKRLQRRRIGAPKGTTSSKKYYINWRATGGNSPQHKITVSSRFLYGFDCTQIAKDTAGNLDINKRLRQIVNFKGIKLNCTVKNLTSLAQNFHIAVISMKNGKPSFNTNSVFYPTNVANNGFFRDYGTSRDVNYNDSTNAHAGPSGIALNNLPISTDQYNVHCHKRWTLKPKDDTNDWSKSGNTYRQIHDWCLINRQLRFNDDSDTNCETPVFCVWWSSPVNADPDDSDTVNAIEVNWHNIGYFRDVLY